jgi:hypothetical protein
MSTAAPPPPRPPLDPLAAVLSYLIPGLGQVIQGRIGKGLLFFVCIYGLFYYGQWLGQWRNVWLPETSQLPNAQLPVLGTLPGPAKAVYYRPQFAAQFWVGAAVWPALLQYAYSGPPAEPDPVAEQDDPPKRAPLIGRLMQAPPEAELNALQRDGDKRWDLGWVYTVIAGVLNLLVIYDALAGPAVRDDQKPEGRP